MGTKTITDPLPLAHAKVLLEEVNNIQTTLVQAGRLPHTGPEGVANLVTTANASSESTSVALANALKAAYNLHRARTDVHLAADGTNAVSSADATNLASAQTLLNEIKTDFNAHIASATFHRSADSLNTISTADASDQGTANALANALKAAFNRHIQMGVSPLVLDID